MRSSRPIVSVLLLVCGLLVGAGAGVFGQEPLPSPSGEPSPSAGQLVPDCIPSKPDQEQGFRIESPAGCGAIAPGRIKVVGHGPPLAWVGLGEVGEASEYTQAAADGTWEMDLEVEDLGLNSYRFHLVRSTSSPVTLSVFVDPSLQTLEIDYPGDDDYVFYPGTVHFGGTGPPGRRVMREAETNSGYRVFVADDGTWDMKVPFAEPGIFDERFFLEHAPATMVERRVIVEAEPRKAKTEPKKETRKAKPTPKAKPRAKQPSRWKSQACTAVDRLADSANHVVLSVSAAGALRYGDALRQAGRGARDAKAARQSAKAAADWRPGRALIKEIKNSATYKLNAIEFLKEGYWLGDALLIERATYWVKRGTKADKGIVAELKRLRIRC